MIRNNWFGSLPSDEAAETYRGQSIAVHFEGVRAVDGVDIRLQHGEIMGLIGPNGAGKTTLVNALTGFTSLTKGELMLGSEPVTHLRADRLSRCGVSRTFQGVRMFERLTVSENVEVGAVCSGATRTEGRRRAREALKILGIDDRSETIAGNLAYGDERRVALARAIVSRPRFLMLDEPAAGLDEDESDELAEIIASIRDRIECGILLIEHDMRVVMGICERIHVIDHGQTIAEGSPESVRLNPAVIEAYLGSEDAEV